MKVIVDTTIWSLAMRRRPGKLTRSERVLERELRELVDEGRVAMLGVIRQELLSGVRDEPAFERLVEALRPFDDEILVAADHEEAARCNNTCRARGIAGSAIDFLICGVALRRDLAIYSTDKDFSRYARRLPIQLHRPRK